MRKNKKILIFSLAYYPKYVGGAEVAIKELTDRMQDIEFHLVCLRFDEALPREERIGNVTVHRIGWSYSRPTYKTMRSARYRFLKLWFQFAAARYGARLHKKYSFNALWAMMAHSCGVSAALFKMFHPKVPYILTLQEGDPPEYIERLMRPLWPFFSRAFTTADIVDAESTFLGRWARRRGFTGPLEVIPNGVDIGHFARALSPEERTLTRKKIGAGPDDTVLITTSRLVPKNAVDIVIRSLRQLPPNVKFVVLGDGPEHAALKELADELGVTSRVRFLGQVPGAELPEYLHAADIFVRPSRSEGMGNSFIEAMAAGLPVIATQEGGIADFLFDRERDPERPPTGFAVTRDNSDEIARAVKKIIADPETARAVVRNARAFIAGRYEWDTIALNMRNKIFGRVMGGNAALQK